MSILQQSYIKTVNCKALLRELYYHSPISRIQLSPRLNCDNATITRNLRTLIKQNLVVEEYFDKSKKGRPRQLLSCNFNLLKTIGISIRPNKIVGIVTNLSYEILHSIEIDFNSNITSKTLLSKLDNATSLLLEKMDKDELLGIGIATYGHFEQNSKIIACSLGFPAIEKIDIEKHFVDKFDIKPEIISTSSALALNYVKKQQYVEGVYGNLNLGMGIGYIMTVDGKLFGNNNYSSQFGHSSCDINGEKCICGRRGCIEAVCSIPAIMKRINKKDKNITFEEVCNEWQDVGAFSKEVEYTAKYLGIGIANLVNTNAPDKVILGGELMKLGDKFSDLVKKSILKELTIKPIYQNLEIVTPKAKDYDTPLGAIVPLINTFLGA